MIKELKWKAEPCYGDPDKAFYIKKSQEWENTKVNEFLHDHVASPETHKVIFLNNNGASGQFVENKYYILLPKDFNEVGEDIESLMESFPTILLIFDYSLS